MSIPMTTESSNSEQKSATESSNKAAWINAILGKLLKSTGLVLRLEGGTGLVSTKDRDLEVALHDYKINSCFIKIRKGGDLLVLFRNDEDDTELSCECVDISEFLKY